MGLKNTNCGPKKSGFRFSLSNLLAVWSWTGDLPVPQLLPLCHGLITDLSYKLLCWLYKVLKIMPGTQ